MKIAFVASSPSNYAGLASESPVDRRRLAALEPVWRDLGAEVVKWAPHVSCDVVYVLSANVSLDLVEKLLSQKSRSAALVLGITEDLLTADWASFEDEHIDDHSKIATHHFDTRTHFTDPVRAARDFAERFGITLSFQKRLLRAVSRADSVICCSDAQAASLRHLNPFCEAIAEAIPATDFPPGPSTAAEALLEHKRADNVVCLVWEGTAWGLQLLEIIREPLEELHIQSVMPLELVVAMPASRPTPFFGNTDNEAILQSRFRIPTRLYGWNQSTVGSLIRACDIGLAPMPTLNPFYRAKAYNKPAVYMHLGLPVVASAIPSYQQLIQHGEDGMIAKTPADWFSNLRLLIEDPALRMTMGLKGQDKLARVHSVERVARQFFDVFSSAQAVVRARGANAMLSG